MKKLQRLLLVSALLTFIFQSLMLRINATETNPSSTEDQLTEFNNHDMSSQIIITDDNVYSVLDNCNIPIEVRNRIEELNATLPQNSEITLIMPIENNTDSSGNTRGWSYYRTYRGMQMRDYIITYDTGHNMANILSSETSKDAGGFCKVIAAICAGIKIDEFIPFGSVGATLIDFMLQDDADTVIAARGDKASAAPNFCRYEYYTYVTSAGVEMLGCTTYYSKIESIAWYYYSQDLDKSYTKVKDYNKYLYSTNFNNRDEKAYYGHINNPHGDDLIILKIGTKSFIV